MAHHIVDKILETNAVQYTVRVNEENEEIVIALQIFCVYSVDELKCGFLAMSLSTVDKSRDCDTGRPISYVDTLWVRF